MFGCIVLCEYGRSPHGERGLKYIRYANNDDTHRVALLMESVD